MRAEESGEMIPVEDDPSVVYDPEALAAAERAAREAESTDDMVAAAVPASADSDEPWVKIATAPSADPGRSLEPVYEALCEAGIPASFDPYRPGVASSPQPFLQRAFHIVVPESQLDAAQAALDEMGVDLPGEERRTGAAQVPHDGSSVIAERTPDNRMSISRRTLLIVGAVILLAFLLELVVTSFPWVFFG